MFSERELMKELERQEVLNIPPEKIKKVLAITRLAKKANDDKLHYLYSSLYRSYLIDKLPEYQNITHT